MQSGAAAARTARLALHTLAAGLYDIQIQKRTLSSEKRSMESSQQDLRMQTTHGISSGTLQGNGVTRVSSQIPFFHFSQLEDLADVKDSNHPISQAYSIERKNCWLSSPQLIWQ